MSDGAEPARSLPLRRCRCGHLPVDHEMVVPVEEGVPGSFRLIPVGPCARCGTACPAFAPNTA